MDPESQTKNSAESAPHNYLEELMSSVEGDDVQSVPFPPGFNTWPADQKQSWAKEEMERRRGPEIQEPAQDSVEDQPTVDDPRIRKVGTFESISGKDFQILHKDDLVKWEMDGKPGKGKIIDFLRDRPTLMIKVETETGETLEILPELLEEDSMLETLNPDQIKNVTEEYVSVTGKAPINRMQSEVKPEEPAAEESGPEWKRGEEWKKFEELREEAVRAEAVNDGMVSVGAEVKRAEYSSYKKNIEDKIRESLTKEAGQNLSPEDQAKLEAKINWTMGDLIAEEVDVYKGLLRSKRSESNLVEAARNVLSNKAVSWYLKRGKTTRLIINTLAATAVGYGVGTIAAGGALAYGGLRVLRGGASALGAGSVNHFLQKHISIDEINDSERVELDKIKGNAELSIDEKTKEITDLKEYFDKARRKAAFVKGALTVAAGAGAGLMAGMLEHAFTGVGITSSAVESKAGRGLDLQGNKLSPRLGYRPGLLQNNHVTPINQVTEAAPEHVPGPITIKESSITEPIVHTEIKASAFTEPVATPEPGVIVSGEAIKLFPSNEVFHHIPEEGASNWKLLGKTWEANDRFHKMTSEQKAFVVSSFTNKLMKDPILYGSTREGAVIIGKPVDFTKLFEDTKSVNAILDKAENLSPVQGQNIIKQTERIAEWVKQHPGEHIDQNKITEIMSDKPAVPPAPVIPEVAPAPVEQITPTVQNELSPEVENRMQILQNQLDASPVSRPEWAVKLQELMAQKESLTAKFKELQAADQTLDSVREEILQNKIKFDELNNKVIEFLNESKPQGIPTLINKLAPSVDKYTVAGAGMLAGAAVAGATQLGVIEGGRKDAVEAPLSPGEAALKSLYSMPESAGLQQQVKEVVDATLNHVYGKKSFWSKEVSGGVESEDWAEMSRLPAVETLRYYNKDSIGSGLPPLVIERLEKRAVKHQNFINALKRIMEVEAHGALKPHENGETMEKYVNRLAKFVVDQHNKGHNTQNVGREFAKAA